MDLVDAVADARRRLAELVLSERFDVARGALIVAAEEYPDLDEPSYVRKLDALAAGVSRTLPAKAKAERIVEALHRHLFTDLGFSGNSGDYYDPKNSFLNEVIDRRTGLPITLAIVYVEVARRLGLRASGVGFPGHFLAKIELDEGDLVVDAFNGGAFLSEADIRGLLHNAVGDAVQLSETVLRPATSREILGRMLQNLKALYLRKGDTPRALSATDRLLIVRPDSTGELRDRGLLCEKLGGTEAARRDLTEYLARAPDADDADEVRATIRRLRDRRPLLN